MSAKNILVNSGRVRTWIEVNSAAAKYNHQVFRRLIGPKVELWPVVKSNAYGHGLFVFSKLMQKLGVDGLCVDSVLEALALRREGIKLPLLVLGPTLPNLMSEASHKKIAITISSRDSLAALVKAKTPPEFHLKFDVGMHRQGFIPKETGALISVLKKHPALIKKLKGAYAHFSSAGDPADTDETEKQFKNFCAIKTGLENNGLTGIKYHISNTGGTLLDNRYHLDLVRVGIGMYGIYPSSELRRATRSLELRPVLSWWTLISEIKKVPPGVGVGYDLTEKTSQPAKLAILPMGYWHGYSRALSGGGRVIIKDKLAKVIGRVSMDLTIVDITNIAAHVGDPVMLLGKNKKEEYSAEDMARQSDTISYEVLTRLNPLIERVLV